MTAFALPETGLNEFGFVERGLEVQNQVAGESD
jgi:hypothetical protein